MTTKKPPVMPDPAETPFVTALEAGNLLGISRHTVYAAIQSGAIPSIRVGRLIRVPVAALRRMAALE